VALARSQIFDQIKQLPNAETITKSYDEAITEFLANKPMILDASLPEGIKMLLQSLETPANLPFARELWMYHLPEFIKKVNEPTLVVIGKKDIQVDWKIDCGLLENAVAQKSDVSFVYPENANHVLKHEELPRDALTAQYVSLHYNAPDAELDVETVAAIVNWLQKQAQK
jgi:hypothetical protein